MAWFDDDPARLQRELEALEAAGLAHTTDEKAQAQRAQLVLEVTGTVAGDTNAWVCTFPDEYPYFPPLVTGEDRGYHHHHNPVSGQHCLLPDGEGRWQPESMTLASLLTEQWPKFLAAQELGVEASSVDAATVEAEQAEPWSVYLPYADQREAVLWDCALNPGLEVAGGTVSLVPLRRYGDGIDGPAKWLAVAIAGPDGIELARRRLNDLAYKHYAAGPEQRLPWVRLETTPTTTDADAWWVAAAEAAQPLMPRSTKGRRRSGGVVKRMLVTFPEEVAHRTPGYGWVAVVDRGRSKGKMTPPRFQRVVRTGREDLLLRAPGLAPMSEKGILVVGLGGLGHQVVRLLASTIPAKLVLWDGDFVEADTAVRWTGALGCDGLPKAAAMAAEVMNTQSQTVVEIRGGRIGAPRPRLGPEAEQGNVHADLVRLLDEVDLVVDATADRQVQHYLSDLARHHRAAYLRADGQPGVWAGLVALQRPEAEVCWMCWAHHFNDKTVPDLPADATHGSTQPPGCGAPTYTGTGFDLAAIAAEAVRVAVAYLTGAAGYGTHPCDFSTLQLRDADGTMTAPTWAGHALERHPSCGNHR